MHILELEIKSFVNEILKLITKTDNTLRSDDKFARHMISPGTCTIHLAYFGLLVLLLSLLSTSYLLGKFPFHTLASLC